MSNLFVIVAFIIGFYLGNYQRAREEARTIKKYIEKITADREIKVISKKEPKSEINEIIKVLEKNDAIE